MILAVSAVIAGTVALFVLGPLLAWRDESAKEAALQEAGDRRRELMGRRQEALSGLKDLQMEFEVGKLTREDYEQQREKLTRQTVEIYREMDQDGVA
ncbi:MAG: hypothetical protein ACREAA_14580 [Candidatus Polarisedimenticolia bacterium]